MADTKELHFFPGVQTIIWVVNGKPEIKADAWGGEEPVPGVKYDVMKPRPTTPGRYVIHSYAPYTTNTWPLSKIAWGTKLTLDASRKSLLYETGVARPAWKKVEDKIPGITVDWVKAQYFRLYGSSGEFDSDRDGIPDVWVFNDFGAWAVRYFRDKNRNKKLDGKESLSGEMLHTTPENEAEVATKKPVVLAPSHGCIHLNPTQREQLYIAGAFSKGTDLVIHSYKETIPKSLR
jgi:hypothetical protein